MSTNKIAFNDIESGTMQDITSQSNNKFKIGQDISVI